MFDAKFRSKEFFSSLLKVNCKPVVVTFINPFSYYLVRDNLNCADIDFFFADGASLVCLHNLFCSNMIDRVSFDFSSIASEVFSFAKNNGLNVTVVGSCDEEMLLFEKFVANNYPGLKLKYCRNGFFNSEAEIDDYLMSISGDVDIIISGMGALLQESFIIKARSLTKASHLFTCGGFITQTAVRGDYYHPIVKKLGLRWLQRAFESSHVRKRLIWDYPRFAFRYVREHLSGIKVI